MGKPERTIQEQRLILKGAMAGFGIGIMLLPLALVIAPVRTFNWVIPAVLVFQLFVLIMMQILYYVTKEDEDRANR